MVVSCAGAAFVIDRDEDVVFAAFSRVEMDTGCGVSLGLIRFRLCDDDRMRRRGWAVEDSVE